MGMVYPELNLEVKAESNNKAKSVTMRGLLNQIRRKLEISSPDNENEALLFVNRLQQELLKIQVFQSQLPLSILLLSHAIEELKQETREEEEEERRKGNEAVLEEFIPPLKKDKESDESKLKEAVSGRDMKDWMSSVQLWNSTLAPPLSMVDSKPTKSRVSDDLRLHESHNKAASQFKGFLTPNTTTPQSTRKPLVKEDAPTATTTIKIKDHPSSCTLGGGLNTTSRFCDTSTRQPSSRKQRRCWSPELHRRFVDALTHLGGPHVATPKQIREMMRVDGLTNDEVKSHLQKYRLHARRVACHSAASATENGTGFVGSWSPQEQYKPSNSHSGSPEGPFQFPGHAAGNSTPGGDNLEDEDDDD